MIRGLDVNNIFEFQSTTNDKNILREQFEDEVDPNELSVRQHFLKNETIVTISFLIYLQDDSSNCSSSYDVFGFENVDLIDNDCGSNAYLEDLEDCCDDISVQQFGDVIGNEDLPLVRQH